MSYVHPLKRIIKTVKKSKLLTAIVHRMAYGALRLLFATYRLKVDLDPSIKIPLTQQPGIYYFWHQGIISGMFFFYKQQYTGSCVISPSRDGKIAGFLCTKLGFSVLYGSSYKSPVSLVRRALTTLRTQFRICLVGDGSRGPAFQPQPGLAYLAHKTGIPLIFIECRPSHCITMHKSWDKFQIPLPFSTILVRVHQPAEPLMSVE